MIKAEEENLREAVAIRCFDLVRVSKEQYPKALMSCNALNDRMRWVKFCIDKERNVRAAGLPAIRRAQ
ncbi:MAG: hypothetical protein EGR12_02020 [Coprococcus catus]|nr:hypothetical protein [Coprococcus catus]